MNNYVLISIKGKNPLLFFKRNISKKYEYSNFLIKNYKTIIIKIKYEDYLDIINKSNIYEINIIKYYGPFKIINFLKVNFSFLISFFISFLFLLLISNVCFNIEIIHNNKEIRELVMSELKENNISKFKFIPSFNKRRKIIDKIIKDNKNKIEWLEIERKGSKLIVKLTERKLNEIKKEEKNRHIVASKNGIIKKIEASSGVIVKEVNDYVVKGDIIVSGDIIKDETIKAQVPAEGLVYAETWYKVNVTYPLDYEEIIYLSKVKNNLLINFFDKQLLLGLDSKEALTIRKNKLIFDNIIPFDISLVKQRKVKRKVQKLTEEEAIKKAELIAEKKISVKLDSDEYIISKKTLNYETKKSKIIIEIFFKVYENITDYKEVNPIIEE